MPPKGLKKKPSSAPKYAPAEIKLAEKNFSKLRKKLYDLFKKFGRIDKKNYGAKRVDIGQSTLFLSSWGGDTLWWKRPGKRPLVFDMDGPRSIMLAHCPIGSSPFTTHKSSDVLFSYSKYFQKPNISGNIKIFNNRIQRLLISISNHI